MKIFYLLLLAFTSIAFNSNGQTENKAPKIETIAIDGKKAPSRVPLNPGEKYLIKVAASDPENDQLKARWELFSQTELSEAIKEKRKPVPIPDMVTGALQNVILDVPVKQGNYRLFLHLTDSHKNLTTASIDLVVL